MTGDETEIAVVGTGFSGLGMAIRLLQAGRRDFTVIERADDVGGTWRDNSYPGAACDVPSNLYSFSFAPNPRWSSSFSRQGEILAYLRDCAERYGVMPHIRFGHELLDARWDEAEARWSLKTSRGDLSARHVVAGLGPLAEPAIPDLPGMEGFEGQAWHSSRWDHDVSLAGRRVAVVGTGASAIQIVPAIAERVEHLDVYQRTPPWIVPRSDRAFRPSTRRIYRCLPAAQLAARAGIFWSRELLYLGFTSPAAGRNLMERAARAHLAAQVGDPDLRARLTPDYAIGCKRILLSDDYYPAIQRPNVEVVTAGIERVTPRGLLDRDGVERRADVIVFGTGFRATEPPVADLVWGRGGVQLREAWARGMAAYKGTVVAGYPNLFLLVGPNTGLGHNSMVYMIESQIHYVLGALAAADAGGATELEVRPSAQAAWNADLGRRLARTVWQTGGCHSWYQDKHGRNTTLWPGFSFQFRHALRHFDPDAYELRDAFGKVLAPRRLPTWGAGPTRAVA